MILKFSFDANMFYLLSRKISRANWIWGLGEYINEKCFFVRHNKNAPNRK
jgi:hypothetical protein